jgi:hypothetical protein
MTGNWDSYKLDIPIQWLRAMAEGDDDDELLVEATLEAADEAHIMIGDWGFHRHYCA